MIVETLVVGPFQSNCTILGCERTRRAVVCDPGADGERILQTLERLDLTPELVILTHGHLDHVLAVDTVRQATPARVLIHPRDRELYDNVPMQARMFGLRAPGLSPPDGELAQGQVLRFGQGWEIHVLETPGHSPGGVSFYLPDQGLALVGDTLFSGSIGRTDLWGGDLATLVASIRERLFPLPGDTRLITGHGPDTTVARERSGNPFLRGL